MSFHRKKSVNTVDIDCYVATLCVMKTWDDSKKISYECVSWHNPAQQTKHRKLLSKVIFLTEVLCTPSSTRPGSNPWPPDHEQYISCPWDAIVLTTRTSGTSGQRLNNSWKSWVNRDESCLRYREWKGEWLGHLRSLGRRLTLKKLLWSVGQSWFPELLLFYSR